MTPDAIIERNGTRLEIFMNPEKQRITIAELCGWSGCVDKSCEYRKCQHLHKGIVIGFPEPYSTSRYPDYCNDLNAIHDAEKILNPLQVVSYWSQLERQRIEPIIFATASQRSEALLKTLGKWKP